MGTRGIVGLIIDTQIKASYNHFDSYPSGLGLDVVKFVKGIDDLDAVIAQARALVVVPEDGEPTPEQVQRMTGQETPDTAVGGEWYTWLRDAQGDLAETLRLGFATDGIAFAANSLFCEWGYLVNLDNSTVEVYRGFQEEPHIDGVFATAEPYAGTTYYPIRRIAVIPFDQLSDIAMTSIEEAEYGEEE